MEECDPLTTDEFIERFRALIEAGQEMEARTFAREHFGRLRHSLSIEQLNLISGAMEGDHVEGTVAHSERGVPAVA